MDNKTYQKSALRTNNPDVDGIADRLVNYDEDINENKKRMDLLHAGMGLVTESGEFMDMLKKHIFYGKTRDEVNLKEEIGDVLWYAAIALEALGTSFDEVMERNIAKLKARYPEKFTEENAINRDLDKEREILED